MRLEAFITENRADMLQALTGIVEDLKDTMSADPAEYTDPYADDATPCIDVRLCVDVADTGKRAGLIGGNWVFRTGLVDFDPRHSQYCGASSVSPDTDAEDLLEDLLSQLD